MKVFIFASLICLLPQLSGAVTCENSSLKCAQESTQCKSGPADFSAQPKDKYGKPFEFLKDKQRDGWHCDCPEGFTGLRCARQYEKCEGNNHYCYHGGKCIEGVHEKVDGDKLFCDCKNANHNGIPYVGKYCEVETQECAVGSEAFCANGGKCKDDFENHLRPCECEDGKRGPHCEFDDGHVPDCDLECGNGGECVKGIKSYALALYDGFWANHDGKFQYCKCPDGFYGLNCEAEAQKCGSEVCFNGGTCVNTLNNLGESIFACDCTTANTDDASYAGQFCQSKSSNFCSKDKNANGQLFCTNNGKCKDNAHEGCECDEGNHGPMCEHSSETPTDASKCDLQCKNGGKCRVGAKDNSLFTQFKGMGLEKFANITHLQWEHCVCPDGFFGIMCEHQLEVCPGGQHVCLHGSKCKPASETDPDDKTHFCDCEDAGNDALQKFAGKFCQYESTDICTKTNGKPGTGKADYAFCVNNGRCNALVDDNQDHPGCTCPDGYVGPHCEYPKGTESQKSSASSKNGKGTQKMNLLISMAAILLCLIAIVSFSLHKLKKSTKAAKAQEKVIEEAFSNDQQDGDIDFASGDPQVEDFDNKPSIESGLTEEEEDEYKDAMAHTELC